MGTELALVRPAEEAGDETAFAAFYESYYRRLVGFAARAFPQEDAEEIAQETLSRVYVRFDQMRPGCDPWPWLTTIARNVGRDIMRGKLRSVPVDSASLAELSSTTGPGADHWAARNETVRELASVIQALSPRHQRILQMREIDELSCTQIADFLGVTPNTARQQVFRARRALASAYLRVAGSPNALLGPVALVLGRLLRRGRVAAGHAPASAVALVGVSLVTAVGVGTAGLIQAQTDTPRRSVAIDATGRAWTHHAAPEENLTPRPGVSRPANGARTPDVGNLVSADAGGLRLRTRVSQPPVGGDEGETHRIYLETPTPVGTLRFYLTGHNSGGSHPVCDAGLPVVKCT